MNSVENDLAKALAQNPRFAGQVRVLEKNENSDLLLNANEMGKEFFEAVFAVHGPYWDTLCQNGFAELPTDCQYVNFVGNQPFFLKNVEQAFLVKAELSRTFFLRHEKAVEKIRVRPETLIELAAGPAEFCRQAANRTLLVLRQNEVRTEFELVRQEAEEFWGENCNAAFSDPLAIARESFQKAVLVLRFSFFASLCYSLKILPTPLVQNAPCELDELKKAIEKNSFSPQETKKFGFFSFFPYDLSSPRLDTTNLSELKIAVPQNSLMRWREDAKLACARYLDIQRKALLQLGKENGLGNLIFFLRLSELSQTSDFLGLKNLAKSRETVFLENQKIELPRQLILDGAGKWVSKNIAVKKQDLLRDENGDLAIRGVSAGGLRTVTGQAIFVSSEEDLKKVNGHIIVCKTLFANLTLAFDRALGIVSESGGALAHAAIIAREYDLPCITQTQNFGAIKNGDRLEINGQTGQIRVLSHLAQ